MEKESDLLGFLILAGAVGFLILSWPVCWWAAAAGAVTGIAHLLMQRCSKREKANPTFRNSLFARLAKDVRGAALSVCLGLCAVAVAQAGLELFGMWASEATVRSWEDHLYGVKEALSSVLDFRHWWKIVLVLLTLSLFVPGWRPLSAVLKRRELPARVLLILQTICSFTFFSAAAVEEGSKSWVAERRSEARGHVETIKQAQRKLVATARLDREIRKLPPPAIRNLAEFIEKNAAKPNDTARWRIERMLHSMPALSEDPVPASDTPPRAGADSPPGKESGAAGEIFAETFGEQFKDWLDWHDAKPPALKDIQHLARLGRNFEDKEKEAEMGLAELVSGLVAGQIKLPDFFAQKFVETAVDSLEKLSVEAGWPKGVQDIASAKEWLADRLGAAQQRQQTGGEEVSVLQLTDIPEGAPKPTEAPQTPKYIFDHVLEWGTIPSWDSKTGLDPSGRPRPGGPLDGTGPREPRPYEPGVRPHELAPRIEYRPPIRAVP